MHFTGFPALFPIINYKILPIHLFQIIGFIRLINLNFAVQSDYERKHRNPQFT